MQVRYRPPRSSCKIIFLFQTCGHCQENLLKLDKAMLSIKEKDASIKELKSLCSRFEKQLSQQDELLKLFAEKKGHKVTNFPK